MQRNGHRVEADVDAAMASHEAKGQTAVLVAIDGDVSSGAANPAPHRRPPYSPPSVQVRSAPCWLWPTR